MEKRKKTPPDSQLHNQLVWNEPQDFSEKEPLTFSDGGGSAVLLREHEEPTDSSTSSWKLLY